MTLRVVVVGPGAVGTFLAAVLARGGTDVTLVGRGDGPSGRAEVRLEDVEANVTVTVTRASAADARVDAPDLIVLAVKGFDLDAALATAARWPDAPVMTVQNGIGAEAIAAAERTSPVVAASLTSAVVLVPGGVRRLRRAGMGVADARGTGHARLAAIAAAFEAGGLETRVYPDAASMKWSKLLANLVGNATSAILDLDPAAIYADPVAYPIERRQLLEARDVMRAVSADAVDLPGAPVRPLLLGVRLPAWLARPVLSRAIGGARGGKSPSLRLHVRGGDGTPPRSGPTEIDTLNGAVALEAGRRNRRAPVNAALAAIVEEVATSPDRAAWFSGRPDRLRAAVEDGG